MQACTNRMPREHCTSPHMHPQTMCSGKLHLLTRARIPAPQQRLGDALICRHVHVLASRRSSLLAARPQLYTNIGECTYRAGVQHAQTPPTCNRCRPHSQRYVSPGMARVGCQLGTSGCHRHSRTLTRARLTRPGKERATRTRSTVMLHLTCAQLEPARVD